MKYYTILIHIEMQKSAQYKMLVEIKIDCLKYLR